MQQTTAFQAQGAVRSRRLVDYVLDQLAEWGVRHIYGVAGDTILPLISAMAERQAPTFVPTRHEEAAAFMAKAEAMLTGNLGVCVATSGPGVAHLVNGLADAQMDSAPVLAITGQQESFFVGTLHRQVINQQQLLGAVTEFARSSPTRRASAECLPGRSERRWERARWRTSAFPRISGRRASPSFPSDRTNRSSRPRPARLLTSSTARWVCSTKPSAR